MHLHVTLNRIVMLHNFVTPNILSHVPKIIQNTQKQTQTAFQTAKIEYFSNGFISNGPFNNWFAQSRFIFFSTDHTASSLPINQTLRQPKSTECPSVLPQYWLRCCTLIYLAGHNQDTGQQFYMIPIYTISCIYSTLWDLFYPSLMWPAKLILEMKEKQFLISIWNQNIVSTYFNSKLQLRPNFRSDNQINCEELSLKVFSITFVLII